VAEICRTDGVWLVLTSSARRDQLTRSAIQIKGILTTDEPNAACAATTDFGLRRESRKAEATPLLDATGRTESGVAAALCHRSPNVCRPCAKLQDWITDKDQISHQDTEDAKDF
jgi:hypothetical protein